MWSVEQQTGDIVINGWEKGIADSPYKGLSDVSWGNPLTVPGEFSVQFPLTTASTSGATLDTPRSKTTRIDAGGGGTVNDFYVIDGKGQVFSADATAQAWTFMAAAGSTGVSVSDCTVIWFKGFIFAMRLGKIYYSTGGAFTDWSTASVGAIDSSHNFALVGTDDVLYFCNGSKVASVIPVPGATFSPATPASYVFNSSALALPSNDIATSLAELGTTLLVGGSLNRIYPWDRISPTFNYPLFIGENYTYRMVTVNTNTYIFPSHPTINNGRGYIYVTNGSQVDIFKKLPDSFNDNAAGYTPQPYWVYGDVMYHRNQIYFGAVSGTGTGGVWAIDLATKVLYRAALPSGGVSSLVTVISPVYTGDVGPTAPQGLGFFTGTDSSMNYTTSTLSTATAVISDKIPVGTFYNKKTFTQVEIKTARALVAGETILVTAILDGDTANPVTVGTMTSTDGMSAGFPVTFQTSQWLQIKCVQTPTVSSPTYVRLTEIRIR